MSSIVRSIKNVTSGYSSSQVKVRNATKNDEEQPTRGQMQEIADLTYTDHEMFLIMDMLDKRLNDKGKNWRHVLKSLAVLDYLVRYGSDNVIIWCRENLYIVKTLREFHYRDDSGHEIGAPIRDRARELTSLLMDVERLQQERSGHSKGRRRRPTRYRSSISESPPRRRNSNEDDDLAMALELSRRTAEEEEERRRMAGMTGSNSMASAQAQTAANATDLFGGNMIDTSAMYQPAQFTGYPQGTGVGANMFSDYDVQQYHLAQQQFQQQQDELARQQALYEQQQAELAREQAALEAQQTAYQQQLQIQQAQQAQQTQFQQPQAQPLKTGSNNPFAAFNQQQQAKQAESRPSLGRRRSTANFDQKHVDQLDQILSLEAPADTFGNTGQARIPAQHTASTYINSAGQGLSEYQTGGGQVQTSNSNPFLGQHYTGLASTEMTPAHTGFGFGNANPNANKSSTNLIDL